MNRIKNVILPSWIAVAFSFLPLCRAKANTVTLLCCVCRMMKPIVMLLYLFSTRSFGQFSTKKTLLILLTCLIRWAVAEPHVITEFVTCFLKGHKT
jgi:hypothetical protein